MNFTVLISAYSINPYCALDGGIAWSIVQALDQKFRLIVITHPRNRNDIEHFLSSSPEAADMQAQFEYYEPSAGTIPQSLIPPGTLVHKYLWHWGIVSFIRRRKLQYDLAHHLSFPCGWCPSFLWRLAPPFIWGPVGYLPLTPAPFIRPYGRLAELHNLLCWGIKKILWSLDPFVSISANRAAHVFAINQQTVDELKLNREHTTILSAVPHRSHKEKMHSDDHFKILCIGHFSPSSGFDLAIRAFARFFRQLEAGDQAETELVIMGRGAAKHKLEQMAKATQLPPGKIRIIESDDLQVIEDQLSKAKVFFTPNHDQSNRLLPQALAHALPVVCFDHKDTYQIVGDCCSLSIPAGTYTESIEGFANHLQTLFQQPDLREKLAWGARHKFERQLTWAGRGDTIAEIYWNVYHRHALMRLMGGDLA